MGKLIYLSGQMTNGGKLDPVENIKIASKIADALEANGHDVFIPHLTWYREKFQHHSYYVWILRDLRWVKRADLVVRIPGESEGADIEVKYAKENGIRVIELEIAFLNLNHEEMCGYLWRLCYE